MKVVTDREELQNLATNLGLALRDKGWTQLDLVKVSGVKQPTISNVLHGKCDPSFSVVSRLAKAVRRPIDDLISAPPRKKLRDAS